MTSPLPRAPRSAKGWLPLLFRLRTAIGRFQVLGVVAAACMVLTGAIVWGAWSTFSSAAQGYDLGLVSRMEAASRILDRSGEPLGSIQAINRHPVPLSSMSPWILAAIVATEDSRFRSHRGVDPIGILRALIANTIGGGIRQGASTITQQLARDSFKIKERTYRRKLLEVALAMRLEGEFEKDRILELYLNRIYFGGGLYGIEAASQGYFGKSALSLNPSESAMLASLVKSPNALSPWRNPARAEAGRRTVLSQMVGQGSLSASQFEEWVARPPKVVPRSLGKGDSYIAEAVRLAVGEHVDPKMVMGGGLTIKTTLDAGLQDAAERAVREHASMVESRQEMKGVQTLDEFSEELERNPPPPGQPNRLVPSYLQSSLVAVDNSSGGILAMVGGRSFWHSEYNRASQSRRPPAGLFTPFLVLSALESGMGSHRAFEDWPLDNLFVGVGGAVGVLGEWSVETETNSYEGPMTMRQLMLAGKNAAAARLGFAVGEQMAVQLAAAAGFAAPENFRSSFYVEGVPASPVELALAYTVFPRLGTRPASAFLVEEIIAPDGEVLYRHRVEEVRVASSPSAWLVADMLREGLVSGPSSRVKEFYPALSDAGVRAGTSYGFEDAWFAGFDARISMVAWMGFDRPAKLFRGAFGSQLAAPLWAQVMRHAQNLPGPIPPPPPPPENLGKFDICPAGLGLRVEGCPSPAPPLSEFALLPGPSPCPLHSGVAPVVPRQEEDSPWPRAQQLIDNRGIRPVNIGAGYIPAHSDPYGSVSPSSMSSAVRVETAVPAPTPEIPIPVARALPVTPSPAPDPEPEPDPASAPHASPGEGPPSETPLVQPAPTEPPLRELTLDP